MKTIVPAGDRLAALLDCQRRILEHIATGTRLNEILATLVTLIEDQIPGLRCALLLADEKQQRLRFVAAPHVPEDYKRNIEPYLAIAPNMGACGTAAYLRAPVYTQDTATDPRWEGCRQYAVRNGLRAIWSTPVLGDDNAVLGTFAMYYGEPRLPDEAHIQLIDMATQMARVAIQFKREEGRLRESESRFRQIAENIHEVFWMSTPAMDEVLYVSPAYEAVWGRSLESLRAQPSSFLEGIHPEDRSRVHQVVQQDRETGFDLTYRIVRPDGSLRWIRDRGFPVRNEANQVYRIVGVAEDVTDRRRAQEQKEDLLRRVINTIPASVWSVKPDGAVDFLNQRFLDYSGLSLEQALAQPTGTVHPEDVARVLEKWSAHVAAGQPFEDEMRLRRADGEYRWFLVRTTPLRDEQQNIVKWYGTSIDIEARKRAEAALQKSERILREAEALGQTGSWEHNLITGEIFNTPHNARLFFGDDTSKGARFEDYAQVIHPDDRAYVMSRHVQLLAEGGPSDIEYRVVWPDGSVHVIFGRASVVRDESGRAVRVYGTNVDATERKRAEAAVRENEQLLKFVLETLPISVVVMDQAGDIILTNAATRRVWAGEIIVSGAERRARVKGFWHSTGKQLSPGEWASAVAVSEGREVVHELIDIEAFDGRRKTIENSAAPIRNSDGAIIGAVVVNHEVTDRVRAETALRESAQRLQHLSRRLLALQEEERRNLSRELHDRLGETLTALSINLAMLKDAVPADSRAKARIEDSAALVKSTAAVMENLIGELRPPMLDDHGLAAALEWYGRQFAARVNVKVSVQASEAGRRLAPDVEIALFRVAQEALNNVAKHARAEEVAINLWRADGAFFMSIADDGIGLARAAQASERPNGLGLVTMRERAQAVGGAFKIEPLPDGVGTRLTVRVPA